MVDKLGERKARSLDEASNCIVPEIFQALAGYNRPVLMECGSHSDSLLVQRIRDLTKNPGSCCELWQVEWL